MQVLRLEENTLRSYSKAVLENIELPAAIENPKSLEKRKTIFEFIENALRFGVAVNASLRFGVAVNASLRFGVGVTGNLDQRTLKQLRKS